MAAVTNAYAPTADTNNVTAYASPSFTPAAGDLLVVLIVASGTQTNGTVTASANGITFTFVNKSIQNTSTNECLVFVADQLVPASPAAMTVTFNCPADAGTGAVVMCARVSGMSLAGTAAIRQSTKQDNQTGGTTPAPVFPASALTGNPTLVVLGAISTTGTTQPAGWTEQVDTTYATPTIGAGYVSRDSGFTGTTITWGSTATAFGDVAIELDASAAAVSPVTDQPTRRLNHLLVR